MSHKSRTAILGLALLLAAAAEAATLVRMNLDHLTAAATVVVRARCLANECRWERSEIWTFTRFAVLETLKGAAPNRITVRLVGGRVGRLRVTVDSAPRFRPGEEVILFLEPTRAGDLSVTAWAEGTFRIHRDPRTGVAWVTQDTAGLAVFDPATRRFHSGGICNLPLEIFRERVNAAIERATAVRQP